MNITKFTLKDFLLIANDIIAYDHKFNKFDIVEFDFGKDPNFISDNKIKFVHELINNLSNCNCECGSSQIWDLLFSITNLNKSSLFDRIFYYLFQHCYNIIDFNSIGYLNTIEEWFYINLDKLDQDQKESLFKIICSNKNIKIEWDNDQEKEIYGGTII